MPSFRSTAETLVSRPQGLCFQDHSSSSSETSVDSVDPILTKTIGVGGGAVPCPRIAPLVWGLVQLLFFGFINGGLHHLDLQLGTL